VGHRTQSHPIGPGIRWARRAATAVSEYPDPGVGEPVSVADHVGDRMAPASAGHDELEACHQENAEG